MGFVFKYVYTCNNIEIYYLILNKKTIPSKTSDKLVFEGGGVVMVGCSRELPTTLKNEPLMLVFEDGVVVVVPRSDHSRKRAACAHFRG